MTRKYGILSILLWILLSSAFASAQPLAQKGSFRKVERPIKGQYIVMFKEDVEPYEVQSLAFNISQKHASRPTLIFQAVKGFVVKLPEAAARALSRNPQVEFVEEDGEASIAGVQYNAPWGLDRIDQQSHTLNGSYNYSNTGAGVNAYVIDTGIRTSHQEFVGRAYQGFDITGGGGQDCNGHGTGVASLIGGNTFGVAKNVRLYAVRVFTDCGSMTSYSYIIQGIDWVTSNHVKPAVANISLAGQDSVHLALQRSINAGITYVVAAGNDGVNARTFSPASTEDALTVAAEDQNDRRAIFNQYQSSNYGAVVDLFAPGLNNPAAGAASNSATTLFSGTSAAAPHVAGVAALYLQSNPTASNSDVSRAILANTIFGVITDSGAETPNRLLYAGFNMNAVYTGSADVPFYRFSTSNPTRHFYTTSKAEGINGNFTYEGIQCYIFRNNVSGTTPLYRFSTTNPLRHFYTTNYSEGAAASYTFEVVQGYIYPNQVTGTVPLYRFRANNPTRHFYTTNYSEGVNAGYIYDGPQGYVYRWW